MGPSAIGYGPGKVDPRLAQAVGLGGAPATPPPATSGQIVPNMPMPKNPILDTLGPGQSGRIDPAIYSMGALPRRFIEDPLDRKSVV